jgi:hypothetical protein
LNASAFNQGCGYQTPEYGFPIQEYRAGTAQACATAQFGSDKALFLAKKLE